MQAANRFLSELRASKVSLGAWQMYPSPAISRTIARISGISWVLIDLEHGNVADSDMHECIANIAPYGVSPLVRLPDSERWMIKRALDAGAHGIMIPLLSSVAEVEEVVIQSKFPPEGKRGFGSPFSVNAFGLTELGDYLSQSNDNTAVIIQVETLSAYENVEAIANVKGVDVLFIGPFDLSNALGHPLALGVEHPTVSEAIQRILEVAHKAGKKAGIFTTSHEDAKKRIEQGFDMVHIGTDVHMITSGFVAGVAAAKGSISGPLKGGY